ncbi:molybdate ABC transporter substrate-binding protein [Bacteroidota bacterium]
MNQFASCIQSTFLLLILSLGQISCTSCSKESREHAAGNKRGDDSSILVFAASSLYDVLADISASYEEESGVKVKMNIASSGTLARQTVQGGDPDLFISASVEWMDYLDKQGYISSGSRVVLAHNELVLIAPLSSSLGIEAIDSRLDVEKMLNGKRLALGDPEHVPAGRYARQALEYYGWYAGLEHKFLPAKDVRSALMLVEMKEASLGIVYRTDALRSDKVKILTAFPEKVHQPIVYVGGRCSDNKQAKDFFVYLRSEKSRVYWVKYGFKK